MQIVPVILCGGSGTRLWPLSQNHMPKQFLHLTDKHSLLQKTAMRALGISGVRAENIVAVTLDAHKDRVAAHLEAVHDNAGSRVLTEPEARNTAVAIAKAALYVNENISPEAIMCIFASDAHIGNEEALYQSLETGFEIAQRNRIAIFGIKPTRPETGYGYIRLGKKTDNPDIFEVSHFAEKPDFDTAKTYLTSGDYLWNSGMFLFKATTILQEYKTHAPDIIDNIHRYDQLRSIPFDKAILEKSSLLNVIPTDPEWSDIGSWQSLWDVLPKDAQGNNIKGDVVLHDVTNCLIRTHSKTIAITGMDHAIIIETPDTVFIADKRNSDAARALANMMNTNDEEKPAKKNINL